MLRPMAVHGAHALEDARVHELQTFRARISGDNARIKVGQMRVVVAAVAGIAQGVGELTFRGKVRGFVVMFEQRPIDGAMRSAGGGPEANGASVISAGK